MGIYIDSKINSGTPNIFSFDSIFDTVEKDKEVWVLCKCCLSPFVIDTQYAYYAGWYCSRECYDTLFGECVQCGNQTMDVLINLEYGLNGQHKEALCRDCFNKKHNLSVVTLRWQGNL